LKPLDFPNNVQIQTTAFCNAACSFCPYPEISRELPMGVMDEDLFRSIVNQLSGRPILLLQPFLMNDPLMDKNIVSRLAYMKSRVAGARINITTNGALLKLPLAKELARLDIDSIHISSNGLLPRTYRATMGIDGAAVLANVNHLADELRRSGARTRLIVTAILMKENREEVLLAQDYWRSRGVAFFLNPLNDRAGNIDRGEFEDMLPFDAEANRSQLLHYDMSGCPALYSFLGILYNGDLVTCCMDWRRSMVMGNARTKSLSELWHDRPYRTIREWSDTGRLGVRELCRKCGENRFSIDSESLIDLLERGEADHQSRAAHLKLARRLRRMHTEEPDVVKMSLIRPTGGN